MIEKILDRLERIDHKEYCGGFEFADSSTFEEMGKCFDERKKLANYTKELQQENKQLKNILTELEEYIKKHIEEWENEEDEYMKGVVAEDKDILQFIQELKEKYK